MQDVPPAGDAGGSEKALFAAARELTDPAQRRAFLDQACAGDPPKRRRLEEFLAAQTEANDFFAQGATALRAFVTERAPTAIGEEPGDVIGRYKLLQQIGEGGFGVVFMAEQQEPVRRMVALKIIKAGMDTREVIARFEAERQALALMDHPNIARVLDGGATDSGRPYFVMDLVKGLPITEYCERHQLSIEARLRLFMQVCAGVQHAHQKGLIHRDLKPNNVLVVHEPGSLGVPKVIDFGIAKAIGQKLTERTLFTRFEQLIGTPAYMSPEQAEWSGVDADTRSDLYSLGVLLYELLTGTTPLEKETLARAALDEIRRMIREVDSPNPSTRLTALVAAEVRRIPDSAFGTRNAELDSASLRRRLQRVRGDLDWIVMKCLEKDRARRYETVNALASDIERHLVKEPIAARPPSQCYRFGRMVRRNKLAFAAGGAVTASLVIALGFATWGFLKERESRRKAEAREKIQMSMTYFEHGKMEDAGMLVNDVLSNAPPSMPEVDTAFGFFSAAGFWYASHNDWNRAADSFATFNKWNVSRNRNEMTITQGYLYYGPALLEIGDKAGYEKFRRAAIARFLSSTNSICAERVCKISLLLPGTDDIMENLGVLYEVAKRGQNDLSAKPSSAFFKAWALISLAMVDYRRGRQPQAIEWCQLCLASPSKDPARTAIAHVILSLANYQLNRKAEARAELAQGDEAINATLERGLETLEHDMTFNQIFDWIYGRILLREARALIEDSGAAKVTEAK